MKNLRTSSVDGSSIVVEWDPPSCPNVRITKYNVFYALGTESETGPINSTGFEVLSVTVLSAVIEDLVINESYRIHVRAVGSFEDTMFTGVADTEIVQVVNFPRGKLTAFTCTI